MAGKPLSWKWKITIALVILILIGIGFVFTPWGHSTMKGWVDTSYEKMLPEERQESELADSYLQLAWWTGFICQSSKSAQAMYKDFLGIEDEDDFFNKYKDYGQMPFKGKFDLKTRTGWGILHPRAPEAFLSYLELYSEGQSGQFIKDEAIKYHTLFYEIYPKVTKKYGKPHPNFYVYWEKIKNNYIIKYRAMPPNVAPKPPEFRGPIELEEGKK